LPDQALDRCARDRALSVVVEDDPALPIGERDEPNSDPVAIRNRLLEIGLRGQLADAPIQGCGRGFRRCRRDRIFLRHFADDTQPRISRISLLCATKTKTRSRRG
jgi:hypothetical protein